MRAVGTSSQQAYGGLESHLLLGPALRHLRSSFQSESVDPGILWLVAAEGFSAWIRHLERTLGDHLDDRHRAREILTTAYAQMVRRRIPALPHSIAKRLEGANSNEVRAFFEALQPGPVARSIRWSLDGVNRVSPGVGVSLAAWPLVFTMSGHERWLEVSHHLGELTIVLTKVLPEHQVPRAIGWLGETCHAFGKEVGELTVSLFEMPINLESAIETLRMGEFLFRVNPEHSSGPSDKNGAGFIEGDACLWYERPGWAPIHCGVLGRFQGGVSEVFGLSYSLTETIPKHGGDTCRITMSPIQLRRGSAKSNPGHDAQPIPWEPKARGGARQGHMARVADLAVGKDPAGGFFGPDAIVWELVRESALLLGGGRAALMQLAHPAVAHAIRDHSLVHQDMLGRFVRTMKSAYAVLLGSIDEATEISKRVYRIHAAISGKLDDVPGQEVAPYRALDPEALFWVGATLIDTTILVYERMVRPLTPAERDRMVRESIPFWVLFGVPAESCAKTWADLHGYVVRRSESLAPLVGESARTQAALLFAPQLPLVQSIFDQIRLITADLLPPPLQRAFRMELNPRERLVARSWLFAAEQLIPRLPSLIRFVPAYHQAQWRLWRAKQ